MAPITTAFHRAPPALSHLRQAFSHPIWHAQYELVGLAACSGLNQRSLGPSFSERPVTSLRHEKIAYRKPLCASGFFDLYVRFASARAIRAPWDQDLQSTLVLNPSGSLRYRRLLRMCP